MTEHETWKEPSESHLVRSQILEGSFHFILFVIVTHLGYFKVKNLLKHYF